MIALQTVVNLISAGCNSLASLSSNSTRLRHHRGVGVDGYAGGWCPGTAPYRLKISDISQYPCELQATALRFKSHVVHAVVQNTSRRQFYGGGGVSHLFDSGSYLPDTSEACLKKWCSRSNFSVFCNFLGMEAGDTSTTSAVSSVDYARAQSPSPD